MKFFGVKYSTVTENVKILSIDANTYLAYQKSSYDLVMMENSKEMFVDDQFRRSGKLKIALDTFIFRAACA